MLKRIVIIASVLVIAVVFIIKNTNYNDSGSELSNSQSEAIVENQETLKKTNENSKESDNEKITYKTVGGITFVGRGDITVTPLKESKAKIPNLSRPVSIPKIYDQPKAKRLSDLINEAAAYLKNNPDDVTTWLQLAKLRKMIDDYVGAAEIWEFLTEIDPTNSTVRFNLAELYRLYLKDFSKSEYSYKEAIRMDKKNVAYYVGLYELYRYSYKKDTDLAIQILLSGINNIPESTELKVLAGNYYKEKNNFAKAKEFYESAEKIFLSQGNSQMAAIVREDILRLTR